MNGVLGKRPVLLVFVGDFDESLDAETTVGSFELGVGDLEMRFEPFCGGQEGVDRLRGGANVVRIYLPNR